jgi:hypothetical protein
MEAKEPASSPCPKPVKSNPHCRVLPVAYPLQYHCPPICICLSQVSTKILFSCMRATCRANLLFSLMTQNAFGTEYKLRGCCCGCPAACCVLPVLGHPQPAGFEGFPAVVTFWVVPAFILLGCMVRGSLSGEGRDFLQPFRPNPGAHPVSCTMGTG